MPVASSHRIILTAIIVGIKELLEPLQKLKIVLKFALDQAFNWNSLQQLDGKKEGAGVEPKEREGEGEGGRDIEM